MLLGKEYIPNHEDNRMKHEGNLVLARDRFFIKKHKNLSFLLERRFKWMNEYLKGKDKIYELGSGPGFLKEYIENKNLKLTDVIKNPWIDEIVDALNMPFENNSIDSIICSHMIHHVAHPIRFIKNIQKKLKPGGEIIIVDINTSFFMRLLLRLMRHEGRSYNIDVFDENKVANDPHDPWSANCAIPQLLFSDKEKFEKTIPGLKIIKNEVFEFMIFPLSGGVISKSPALELPNFILKFIEKIDNFLIKLSPQTFALGRKVVIKKN